MHLAGQELMHLLDTYGYWAVLVFVMIESIGIPVPGETMLLTAAIYSGRGGHLLVGFIIAAAAAGAIIGDNIGYVIGREGGFRLLRRYGRYVRLDERKLKVGQYVFMRHGASVVFFGRFVALLRALAALLAGVNRMPWWRFFVANAAGGVLWATVYGLLGWALGDAARQFEGKAAIFLGLASAAAAIGGIIFTVKNGQRLEDKAEQALPGPLRQRPAA
ncbi:MAG TPA: DedA family protein [Chloroflexota bacterium]|nr:DedA family protein [Chloroflexota bacterium]